MSGRANVHCCALVHLVDTPSVPCTKYIFVVFFNHFAYSIAFPRKINSVFLFFWTQNDGLLFLSFACLSMFDEVCIRRNLMSERSVVRIGGVFYTKSFLTVTGCCAGLRCARRKKFSSNKFQDKGHFHQKRVEISRIKLLNKLN